MNNHVYNGREIYTIRGDMCYDNKLMMNASAAHPERTHPQTVCLNITESDRNVTQQKQRPNSVLRRIKARLRLPHVIDLFILLLVGALMGAIEFGLIPNTKIGFTCDDPKLSYPYRGDTISGTTLLLSSFFGPLVVIVLVEVLRERELRRVCVGTVWHFYKECVVGALLVLLVTEVMKVLVGEQRPHFLHSCKPNVSCAPGAYVEEYSCTNTKLSRFLTTDITRSFPSGHTSISIYVALYLSYLIQTRLSTEAFPRLTKPLLIGICLSWSLLCSLSRITDRRHHWWDVLTGAFLGASGALYTSVVMYKKEKTRTTTEMARITASTTTLLDVKNKDATSVII